MSKFGKTFFQYCYSNYGDVSWINFTIFLQCFWSSYCVLHPVLVQTNTKRNFKFNKFTVRKNLCLSVLGRHLPTKQAQKLSVNGNFEYMDPTLPQRYPPGEVTLVVKTFEEMN